MATSISRLCFNEDTGAPTGTLALGYADPSQRLFDL
jgi:hypothetical protein